MKTFVSLLVVALAATCYAVDENEEQHQPQGAGIVRGGFCGLGGCFGGMGGSRLSGGSGGRGNQAFLERAPGFPSGSGSGSGGRRRFPGFRRSRRDLTDGQETQELTQTDNAVGATPGQSRGIFDRVKQTVLGAASGATISAMTGRRPSVTQHLGTSMLGGRRPMYGSMGSMGSMGGMGYGGAMDYYG